MREADIRPADVHEEYLRLSAADAASFFPDRSGCEYRTCPGCAGEETSYAFEKNGFDLVSCRSCGTLYVNPAPVGAALESFYRDSPSAAYWARVFFPAVAEARRGSIFRPRVQRILEMLQRHGHTPRRVIDVGAGSGILLEEFAALSPHSELRAVEPGKELAASCREKGVTTFEGFAEDAATVAEWAATGDLVTSFEVIEHVPAMDQFLDALAGLARPGGIVLASGLCGDGFDIQLLGRHSNAVSPPHHLNFLSRKGVEALVRRRGLELLEFTTPGRLDVDIVCNALAKNRDAVADSEMREFLSHADTTERAALQERLCAEGRSSHMWLMMRKPDAARGS